MPFPKDWTKQDEINALEGIDAEKSDTSGYFDFKTYRETMVNDNGWTGTREETQILYALFNLFIDEVEKLMDEPFISFSTPEDQYTVLDLAYNKANEENFAEEDPKSFDIIKNAYDKSKALHDELEQKKNAEKEAEKAAQEKAEKEKLEKEAKEKAEQEKQKKAEEEKLKQEEIKEEKKEEAPKKPELTEEDLKRAEMERLMEEANKRAEEQERLEKEQEEAKKREQEQSIENGKKFYDKYVRDLWMEREACERVYAQTHKSTSRIISVENSLRDYFRANGVDKEVERVDEVTGEKYMSTLHVDYTFVKSLDDVKPKNWTPDELKRIDELTNAILKSVTDRDNEKENEKKEAERLDAEEKALPRMTPEQVKTLHDRVKDLKNKGIDIDEFEQSYAYRDYCETKNIDYNNAEAPLQLALMSNMGPKGCTELLKFNSKQFEDAMATLNDIEQLNEKVKTDDKKFGLCDADAFGICIWLNSKGQKNLKLDENDHKEVEAFDFDKALNEAGKDRDNLYGFETSILTEAKTLYTENKEQFDRAFSAMSNLGGNHAVGQEVLNIDKKELENLNAGTGIYEGHDTLKKLNQFCHLLYKIKQTDKNICKIGTDKNPVYVEPIDEDTDLTASKTKVKEINILDKCYDMLEKSKATFNNSEEYKKIMTDIEKLKDIVNKDYDNAFEADQAYAEGIKTVLKDINLYRKHKAVDGIKKDVTLDKLVAVERIDKLLQGRYQVLANEEYKDPINSTGQSFDANIEDKMVKGKNFVLAVAYRKISNISKNREAIENKLNEEAPGRKSVNVQQNNKTSEIKNEVKPRLSI